MTPKPASEVRGGGAVALLLCAGRSSRMGGARQKTLLSVGGEPVALRSARALLAARGVRGLVVVARSEDRSELEAALAPVADRVLAYAEGGPERIDSVRAGTRRVPPGAAMIVVHDAARCLVRAERVEEVLRAAERSGAAVLAVPVRDTIKRSRDGARVAATIERSELFAAQTPQAARADLFRAALDRAEREGFVPTDDVALIERAGGEVELVHGDDDNLKLTTPTDVAFAEAVLARRAHEAGGLSVEATASPSGSHSSRAPSFRVGLGFDVHRMEPGRRCVLGGVEIPAAGGPAGHSDGDAVLHALIDALTGAAGLDDVGTLFPDDDPRYAGADSAELLRRAVAAVRAAGWSIANADAVLVGDEPKLRPHRAAMRARIGELLGIDPSAVNVKGKTTEGLGDLRGGAGIAVQVVCLLQR